MRISLHIVVALLLIALIYREILKGILPPVCGNNWRAQLPAGASALSLSSRSFSFKSIYSNSFYTNFPLFSSSSFFLFFFEMSLWRHPAWILFPPPVCGCWRCICLQRFFSLPLSVLYPPFVFLQDSEAAAENGNRDTGQSLPFWLK